MSPVTNLPGTAPIVSLHVTGSRPESGLGMVADWHFKQARHFREKGFVYSAKRHYAIGEDLLAEYELYREGLYRRAA